MFRIDSCLTQSVSFVVVYLRRLRASLVVSRPDSSHRPPTVINSRRQLHRPTATRLTRLHQPHHQSFTARRFCKAQTCRHAEFFTDLLRHSFGLLSINISLQNLKIIVNL